MEVDHGTILLRLRGEFASQKKMRLHEVWVEALVKSMLPALRRARM
jgi:hypothetical protein